MDNNREKSHLRAERYYSQQKPIISLIITAYNRKEYILESIKSALNQTLNKKFFEVIVIKNYEDPIIDEFIKENNIKMFISDGIEGEYTYLALKMAEGEIISFLDDDDIMNETRLERVFEIFRDNKIGYYHNNFEVIMDNKIIRSKLINSPNYSSFRITNRNKLGYVYKVDKRQLYLNNSCISIRKEILNSKRGALRYQNANIDRFIFISAMLSDLELYFDNFVLTSYRIHNNQTGALISGDFETLVERKLLFIKKSIDASINIKKISKNTRFNAYADTRLMNLKLAYNFWAFENKFKFRMDDYLLYLKEKDFVEMPLILVYKAPRAIRRAIIKMIYGV